MTDRDNEHEPERAYEPEREQESARAYGYGYGQAHGYGGWEPVPHGGEYEPDATAFVQLPPDMDMMGAPLEAPGHGYVPPMIVPLTPAAATDPGATGVWRIPTELSGQGPSGAPESEHAPGAQTVVWPEPPAPTPQPATPTQPAHDPSATAQWNFADEPSLAGTGQWTIPVARGELPEESGEFTTSSLIEQWGSTPPATLPGGAPAPWAHQFPEPAPHPAPGTQEPTPEHAPSAPGDADAPDVRNVPDAPVTPASPHAPVAPHAPAAPTGHAVADAPEASAAPGTATPQRTPQVPDVRDDSGAPGHEDSPASHPFPHAYPQPPEQSHAEAAPQPYPHPDATPAPHPAPTPAPEAGSAPQPHPQPEPHPLPETSAAEPVAEVVPEPETAAPEATGAPAAPGEPTEPTASEPTAPESAAHATTPTGDPTTPPGPDATHTPEPATPGPEAPASASEPQPEPEPAPAAPEPASSETVAAPAAPEDAPTAELTAPTAEPAAPPADVTPAPDLEHPRASYVLRVNGADRPVTEAWVGESLLYVLRERLGLAGAKDGCSQGECGACNVQVDGRLVASCLVPAATAAGSEVRTVEGLATDGEPSDVQRALAECGAVQCGFCIPGMAMTVHDLLEGNHAPTELETRQALCGNLCRCSGYRGVLDAVKDVVAAREAAGAPADEPRIPHQAPPGAGSVQPPHTHDGGMA
ncbi:2Fe-2S iron-sulfur cluster-binding protein [Streptomyces sp. NPDC006660]|uniref:(2Fe-2S)-binding protein n=1 Tax=Streptomyces sp. NPDC006660 TaxID=3156901 RepID=UPI00340AC19E